MSSLPPVITQENKILVLDHGYVQLVECWGRGLDGFDVEQWEADNEVGIIEAARMSTNKGFKNWEEDARLLSYLYDHKHMTPFEMAGMTIEVKAPIFVFREWHRHRTQSYNEMSARYIPLPDENYVPTVERMKLTSGANKQAQGTRSLASDEQLKTWLVDLDRAYQVVQDTYMAGLDLGIPKELARLPVTVARYSRMRASANLRNWLAFLTLRMDHNAQWEIRQFANAVGIFISRNFPRTWESFEVPV